MNELVLEKWTLSIYLSSDLFLHFLARATIHTNTTSHLLLFYCKHEKFFYNIEHFLPCSQSKFLNLKNGPANLRMKFSMKKDI